MNSEQNTAFLQEHWYIACLLYTSAKTIPNDNPETVRCGYALHSHPAVLDGFIDLVREEQQHSRTQGEKRCV